jgi:hypothetical protein
MLFRKFISLFALLLTASAFAGELASPATQPVKPADGYRFLEPGSWIVIEAHVRTNGSPAAIKRRIQVTVNPKTGERAIEEARWVNDTFVPTGALEHLPQPDRRTFDQLGLTPDATLPDQVLMIGRKRYVCSVSSYLFADTTDGRSTHLTLWRDKSGSTQLPPRTLSINHQNIPLPGDALQADFTVDGPNISTRGERRILSLAAPLRVNGQTCNCLVEGTQTRGMSNNRPLSLTVREWFCHDLPGERLRTLTSMTAGAMNVESDITVLDFHVSRVEGTVHAFPTSRPVAE